MTMPTTFNTHEAKTHFSKILHRIECGEEIIIAKAGKPVAKLIPIRPIKPKKIFGGLKGKIKIADDFDAPLPKKIINAFYNKKEKSKP